MCPLFEWQCESCGASKAETVPLSEVGDGKRHPMDEKPPCPRGHGLMTPLLGGRPHISQHFPLWDAGEKYAAQVESEDSHPQEPSFDRYEEAQERKRGEERIRRDGAKVIV